MLTTQCIYSTTKRSHVGVWPTRVSSDVLMILDEVMQSYNKTVCDATKCLNKASIGYVLHAHSVQRKDYASKNTCVGGH